MMMFAPLLHPGRCALVCWLVLVLGPAGFVARAAKPGEIVMGTILPSGTEQYRLLQELGQRWRKESEGKVRLILHPDGRLGGETDMVKKIGIGQINAGVFSVVGLSEISPEVAGLQLMPLTFQTWAEVDYVREKLRPVLEKKLRAHGFYALCWADAGWVRFFSAAPAVTPDDYRATKLFAWAGDEVQIAMMKSVGFRPVALETTDLLVGLQTKLINAAPLPPMVALAGQVHGPAPYMLDLKWCPIVGAAVVRADVWEKIPEELRSRLAAAAEETGRKLRARGRLEDEEAIRAMQKHGLKVTPFPATATADWQGLKDQVYPKVRGAIVPDEIFDAVEGHLRDFRATQPEPAR
ncbi:MAG: TRAP transporter substrate-binding protein DctP [Opitutaceae bacterium]|nr:TRAP transporter substrate-binding protein DctP [Opitutaceae bacterium]